MLMFLPIRELDEQYLLATAHQRRLHQITIVLVHRRVGNDGNTCHIGRHAVGQMIQTAAPNMYGVLPPLRIYLYYCTHVITFLSLSRAVNSCTARRTDVNPVSKIWSATSSYRGARCSSNCLIRPSGSSVCNNGRD